MNKAKVGGRKKEQGQYLTRSQSTFLKNGWPMMSAKPVWGWQPRRSLGSCGSKGESKWDMVWDAGEEDGGENAKWRERWTAREQRIRETSGKTPLKNGDGECKKHLKGGKCCYGQKSGLLTLLRNPLRTLAALTDNERGILICFSNITAGDRQKKGLGEHFNVKMTLVPELMLNTFLVIYIPTIGNKLSWQTKIHTFRCNSKHVPGTRRYWNGAKTGVTRFNWRKCVRVCVLHTLQQCV